MTGFSVSFHPLRWYWWRQVFDLPYHLRKVKWYFQRANRGWADCDTWGLDSYICEVLVPALEHLKKWKHGYPVPPDAVFTDDCQNATDEEYARWQQEWDARLDEMIAGFRAAAAMQDIPDEFVSDDPESQLGIRLDMEAMDKWRAEQEAIRQKGFAVFTEYFHALWD